MSAKKGNPCRLKRAEKSSSLIEVDGPSTRIADVDCSYELRKIVCVPDGWLVAHGSQTVARSALKGPAPASVSGKRSTPEPNP